MNKLVIKGTEETPTIVFDKDKPEFKITGKSFMEDVQTYYEPILSWLEAYKEDPNQITEVTFEIEYINTASSKMFLDILSELNDIHLDGKEIRIIWRYYEDDEDMEEMGHEFADIYELPFEFKEVEYK